MPDNTLTAFKKGWPRSWFKKQEILGPIVGELQDVVEDIRNGTGILAGVITGAKATPTFRAKDVRGVLPTVATGAGTTEITLIAGGPGTLSTARITFKDGLIASDSNWIQVIVKNKGQTGVGTNDMLDTGAVNTNKVTGGTALVAYGSRVLTVNATPANLIVAAGDVLVVQIVATGTLPNTLTEGSIKLVFDQVG